MKKTVLISVTILVLVAGVMAWYVYLDNQVIRRPQTPSPPYPYYSEEVSFKNQNVTLAGTLTLPSKTGKYPVVVLISGSGAQNRDGEMLNHKPFLVLADHLTRNGIGVLRYDDRGFGKSTGNFKPATSDDFSHDAESAVNFLKSRKDVDTAKIGLIGHSEGGLIAPMVAARSKDVAVIVLLAGPGMELKKLLLIQDGLIAKAYGMSDENVKKLVGINEKAYELVIQSTDINKLKTDMTRFVNENISKIPDKLIPAKMTREQVAAARIESLSSPWFQYALKYNPEETLVKVKCPVLAINGEKDIQVVPEENLSAIKLALKKGGNTNVTTKELPNLNHLFQECKTGSPAEYGEIEQTFAPAALNEISGWILKQVK
ncbi:S9 family peptidase [Dyadobacter sp. CY312]|uniref:alpha/beta hydrolase family protein n=1 Tax=Dyadobacter sp. CY312 TaxID=2907303 RepID=UPI001F1D55E5|nr:alpha/beta fold hydrolase [Dyadobacter sp. CY312]MCE7039725.1 alpha/beta fold hydrolase [Dyadobacter sp. CY312]